MNNEYAINNSNDDNKILVTILQYYKQWEQ